MYKRLILLISISFLPFILLSGWMMGNRAYAWDRPPTATEQEASPRVWVYYSGPEDQIFTALQLYEGFIFTEDPSQAQVFVVNGRIPEELPLTDLVQAGKGFVVFMSPETDVDQISRLVDAPVTMEKRQQPLSLIPAPSQHDALIEEIVWNSSPQVRERFHIESPDSRIIPLVIGYEEDTSILVLKQVGKGQVFLFMAFLQQNNPQFQEWAYFNYFIYHLTLRAAGLKPTAFADYPASPVPHTKERVILLVILTGLLGFAIIAFLLVRRYSREHPELLNNLVIDRSEFETHQAHTDWEQVGFHRPLGGFLFALMLGLVLFVPVIIYQNLILPVYILPSAQALGIWGRVLQFFNMLWLFLDMGTSAAFIKFFSQYRVHDPRKAIQFGQVFVWWQALSGAVQVALVVVLAGTFMPKSVYALYTWSVIIHTFIQIPGFFQLMHHAMAAWQRFDYAQMLDLGLNLVFPMITQPILVSLMVLWGRNNPVFGSAMGGLLGLGLAAYASEVLSFSIGLLLYRRLGYNARLLFLAHFDWNTVKTAFRFGIFEMLGSVAWTWGQSVEILITQAKLVNYTEIWGNWGLAQNFVFAYNATAVLFNNLMPSISEAFSQARRKLSQYYSVMAYKWGGFISLFIGAVLLAVGDRFILGASGPEFVRAAYYTIPLVIWGAIQYPSWVGDQVQLGSNRPYLKAIMVFGEQTIRIVLAFILIERFQIYALIIAYFIGLLTKDIAAYFVNHRLCFPQRFYFWQSLGAPFLAAVAHYLLLRWITGFIWQGDQITSVLIFLIGILFSFPVYVFFYGLFGGWDEATLAELNHATNLSNFMRPMARLFWFSTALGARLSPLHGRFPIDIRTEALQEAEALTEERVHL